MISGNRFVAPYYAKGRWYAGWGSTEPNEVGNLSTEPFELRLNFENDRRIGADGIVLASSLVAIAGDYPPIAIFRRNYSAGYGNLIGRIYWLKISNGSVLVRDFIPVRFTNEQGVSEGAMYDHVSGQLFRNQGTGSFVIGPDKHPQVFTPVMRLHNYPARVPTAKDYVQDGLIAMWDGIENAGWGVHDAAATEWVDLSGNENHMVPYSAFPPFDENSIFFSSGVVGARFWYIGTPSAEMANISRNSGYSLTMEIAYSFTATGGNAGLLNLSPSPSMRYSSMRFYASQLYFTVSGGNQIGPYASLEGCVSFTVKDVGGNQLSRQIFVNGEAVYDSTTSSSSSGGTGVSAYLGNNITDAGFLTGHIYASRIYSRAHTAAEIAANYAVDKERFNLP